MIERHPASVRPEPGSVGAALVPMSEHVERFWRYLETETVRIIVDMRREMDNGCVYYDSSSLSDDVAKALVADRKSAADALSAKDRELAEARAYHQDALQQLAAARDQRDEALSALREKEERIGVLEAAISVVTNATAAYLPPNGISKDELISRVLAATDNPEINAVMLGGRNGSP